jgi:hypothetical protein
MGTYATTTALSTTMVGVNFNTATSLIAAKMITQAEQKINSYLSRRYDLSSSTFQTTTSIPPQITTLCERLAEGYMWKSISRGSKESITRGKELVEECLKELQMISDCKVDLLNTAGSAISELSTGAYRVLSNTTNYATTFDEDDELSWAVSSEKLEDISDGRE